jgi:hypothetical protein
MQKMMKTSTINPFKAKILFPHDNENVEIVITPDDKLLYVVRGCSMMSGSSIIINASAIDALIATLKDIKAIGHPGSNVPSRSGADREIDQDDYYMMQEILQEMSNDAEKKGYKQDDKCKYDGTKCDQLDEMRKSRDDIMRRDIEYASERKKFFHLVKIALGIDENATEDNCLDMIANLVSKRDENNHDGNEK